MKLIDITRELLTSPLYPGDPPARLEPISTISTAEECNLSLLHTCLHTGTHIDAPVHYLPGAASCAELSLTPFFGPCTVQSVPPGPVAKDVLYRILSTQQCPRVLLHSEGAAWLEPGLLPDPLPHSFLLVGTDALSIGAGGTQGDAHRLLLAHGVAILESLDLSHVQDGNYFLCAPPLKISHADGSPARAFLWDGLLE